MTTIKVPERFILGAASSAYQLEGAWNEVGKGLNFWNTLTQTSNTAIGNIPGNSDHYHRLSDDRPAAGPRGTDRDAGYGSVVGIGDRDQQQWAS